MSILKGRYLPYVRPNSEDEYPRDASYAADGRNVQAIHVRYLIDLRACVVADGSRPDVVAELDERIDGFEGCPIYTRSLTAIASEAIEIAKTPFNRDVDCPISPLVVLWEHSAEAVVNELCCPDRMRDMVADALEYDFDKSVASDAADAWLTYFRQTYH